MAKDDDKKKVEKQKPRTEIKKKTPTKAKKVDTKKPVKKTETKVKTATKKQTPAKKKPAEKKPVEIKKKPAGKKATSKPATKKEEKPKKEEEEAEIIKEEKEEKYKVKKKPTLEKKQQEKLVIRKQIKKRTPDFLREEWFRYKRIPKNWRRPDGITSKMRINLKYRPSKVRVGFRGPKDVRGLHSSGFEEIIVHNVNQLEKINPKTQAARIGGSVGTKKRIEIEKKADELEVRILNR